MPQESAIFSAARIRVWEKSLIGADKLNRLVDGSAEDDFKALSEWNYGGVNQGSTDIDSLVSGEMKKAYDLVCELTSDEKLTNVFFIRNDVQNLKLLIKKRMLNDAQELPLSNMGTVAPELLRLMVKEWSFDGLPEEFTLALAELFTKIVAQPDPQAVSVALDRAYINYALHYKDDFVREYFAASSDFSNIETMLRVKTIGADAKRLLKLLMPTCAIDEKTLTACLGMGNAEQLNALCSGIKHEKLQKAVKAALTEYMESMSIAAVERARDNYLIELARRGKGDMETVAPVIGYYLAKEQEAKCIRLVLTAKRNNMDRATITERLRELYG